MRTGVPAPSHVTRPRHSAHRQRAVAVADPVLVLEVGARAGDAGVDLVAQSVEVVEVDELEPGRHPLGGRVLVAQQRSPALGEVHAVGGEVPVPDAVIRCTHSDGVALLAAPQVDHRLVLADGVADRPLQAGGVDRSLDQIVGDAERGRLHVHGVVVLAGEQDDRRRRVGSPRVAHEIQARVLAQPVVDEVQVVAGDAHRIQRGRVTLLPLEVELGPAVGQQHALGEHEIVLVVFHQQDAERVSPVHRRSPAAARPGRTSNRPGAAWRWPAPRR